MKQTKDSGKSEAQSLCSKCPPFTRTHAFKWLRNHCRDDGVVQQPPLHQQTFFQLLHIMYLWTVDPLLKYTPDAVSKSGELCGHISVWRDKIWHLSLQHGDSVTCTVNGMISVTSILRHQVRDVHDMQCSKFTSMISIHLQSCVPKIIKIRAYL